MQSQNRRVRDGGAAIRALSPVTPRISVEDQVVTLLRDQIVSGGLPGGTRLVHRDVAQRLGISPTPVRVGLARLEQEGLITTNATGRGIVSQLSREEYEEICVARIAMEGFAARLGAPSLTEGEIQLMRRHLATLRQLARPELAGEYLKERWQFHEICYRASGRLRLVGEVESLFWRAERYNRLYLSDLARFGASLGYYADLLRACEHRDGDAAAGAVQHSIRDSLTELMQTLPSEFEAPKPEIAPTDAESSSG